MEFERLLRESQREVLRLQRQLSVTSSTQQHNHSPDPGGPEKCGVIEEEEADEKVLSSPYIRKHHKYAEPCPCTLKPIKSTVTLDMRSKGKLLSKFYHSFCAVRILLNNRNDKSMPIVV